MKFFAFSALVAVASANQYYGGARLTGVSTLAAPAYTTGYNTLNTVAMPAMQKLVSVAPVQRFGYGTGYGAGYSTGLVGGYTYGQAAVAPLAVQTQHSVQYVDAPSGGSISPIQVEVDANPIPINMLFRSASSQLTLDQAHQGAVGSSQETQSEDEAHFLKHTVTKPVVQEVREVITPFRKIEQQVLPVQESINTVVARGVNKAVLTAPAVQTFATDYARPAYTGLTSFKTLNTVAVPAIQKVIAQPTIAVQRVGLTNVNTYNKEY